MQQILAMLTESPPQMARILEGLTTEELHTSPSPGEWSARDVLAHLRACADVWGDCILTIISQDSPTIRAVNPRTWIEETDYREQAFESSFEAFRLQRTGLLDVLRPLSPNDWSRSATVIGAGAPLQRSVQYYANWTAVHESSHLKQMKKIAQALGR